MKGCGVYFSAKFSRTSPWSDRKVRIRMTPTRTANRISNRFWLAKQQLYTCITLFCTLLSRSCTTTTWKCLISRFVEDRNNIWRIKRDGIWSIANGPYAYRHTYIHPLFDKAGWINGSYCWCGPAICLTL